MKHISHIISAFICLMAATSVSAQQISESDAKEIAQSFLSGQSHHGTKASTGKQLSLVYTQASPADAATANLYVFSNPQGGFAIVAADERVGQTILGYSDHGTFNPDNMPDNVRFWLSDYARQIDFVKTYTKAKKGRNIKALDGSLPTGYTVAVNPLITTRWGQDEPYNEMTPQFQNSLGQDEHSRTGCVATAMAQVMAYHKYPEKGKGSHEDWWSVQASGGNIINHETVDFGEATYNWVDMTNGDIAKLMYHCGIAVDMAYDIAERGGSGAVDNLIGPALKTYFGYSKQVSYVEKKYFTDVSWIDMMTKELDNSRPVIYGAWDSHHDFGHELILDGYATKSDTDVMFHINWGWDGACDGYYALSALEPNNAGTNSDNVNDYYDSNHVATIKIQKPTPDTDPDVKEWADVGWSDVWSDFGTGVWYDVFTIDPTTEEGMQYTLKIRTNNTYSYMKQIKVVAWNTEQVIQNMNKAQSTSTDPNPFTYTKGTSDIDLIFNWNTALNICFMPDKQYMGISQSKKYGDTKNIYYRNAETGSKGSDTDNGYYNVATQTFTIDFVQDFLNTITGKFDTESPNNNFGKTTATLKLGGAFYLRDFIESNNHKTATQEANIYDCSYFRTKLVPVEDILGKTKITDSDNLISYYKNLADVIHFTDIEDYLDATDFSSWISEKDVEQDEEDGNYYITYDVPAEGAYYAIVVFTDENGETILGFDYEPVYFSSSNRWKKLGHGTLIDNLYWPSFGGLCDSKTEVPIQDYYAPYKVEVEEYLDETANTKLYRLKNPFYYDEDEDEDNANPYFSPAWKAFAVQYNDPEHDEFKNSHTRKDVYLYFYKDQYGNVSLYPNVFERQPLGYDWSYGEVMLSAVKYPAYTCMTLDGDKNATETIQFPAALLTSYDDSYNYNVEEDINWFDEEGFPETPNRKFTLKLHTRELNDATAYTDSYKDAEKTAEKNYVNRVTYTRDDISDWGTLVLPFDYSAPDGFTFYKLKGYSDSDSNLTFVEITKATANTPIVFKRNTSTSEQLKVYATDISLSDAETWPTVSTPDGAWSEIGTYSPVAITTAANATSDVSEYYDYDAVTDRDLTKAYLFDADKESNAQATQASAGIRVPSYRAFFYNNSTASAPKVVRMLFDDGTSTSIETVTDDGVIDHSRINTARYNLAGQPVTKEYKGIVIENGRKMIKY